MIGRPRRTDPAPGADGEALFDDVFGEFTGFYRRNRKAYARLNRDRVPT